MNRLKRKRTNDSPAGITAGRRDEGGEEMEEVRTVNIGERIKNRRLQLGLSVDELAKRIGKNRATVYRYESNIIEDLPISILEPLSKALEVTPNYILGNGVFKNWDQIQSPNEKLLSIVRKVLSDKLSKRLADELTAEIGEKLLEYRIANMYAERGSIMSKLRSNPPPDERELLEGLKDSIECTIKRLEQELSDMRKKGNS